MNDKRLRVHRALHHLWTKAVGQNGYVKADWLELDDAIQASLIDAPSQATEAKCDKCGHSEGLRERSGHCVICGCDCEFAPATGAKCPKCGGHADKVGALYECEPCNWEFAPATGAKPVPVPVTAEEDAYWILERAAGEPCHRADYGWAGTCKSDAGPDNLYACASCLARIWRATATERWTAALGVARQPDAAGVGEPWQAGIDVAKSAYFTDAQIKNADSEDRAQEMMSHNMGVSTVVERLGSKLILSRAAPTQPTTRTNDCHTALHGKCKRCGLPVEEWSSQAGDICPAVSQGEDREVDRKP